jgi:predicted helicase
VSLVQDFLQAVIATHKKGNATEHSYRPALQQLFNALDPKVSALNEPKREKVGAPDFSISRGDIVIGHCEAKDLPIDLKTMKEANLAQKKRYVGGLSNLLYTNCLEWLYYRDGELVAEVRIGDFLMGVQPMPDRFPALEQLLRTFIAQTPQTITSSRALAERMAGKAVLIKDILANSLMEDSAGTSELMDQYNAFKEHLIHDISIKDFADIYAETITYGMFAARLHDTSLDTFSRQEALELLPKSNPFLRNLFGYIAGPNLDPRIVWIIDDLARVFQASNVSALMEKYGKTTQRNDPFLHFYEDFLKAYNPEKRDARGVWYTPEPVVNFIVRAVDDVLKTEFGLADGLADTSKVTIPWDTGQKDKKGKPLLTSKEVHRVQILDPATGTGTFLAEVIKQIAPRVKNNAPGMWASYVEKDLIPRLHGFELLMASYAMCHMKLDMVLREFGYTPTASPPRVSVYLTNSLEEGEAANQTLPFAQWLSNEVKEANKIKRDMPIMCVIGNPPYNNSSPNKGEWILDKIRPYKAGLTEKKINLDDDYIKFIRLAQLFIEQTGVGVVAFITNNSFLSGVTHRQMRRSLLESFNSVYVLNLHGDSNKGELTPDGKLDANVFDIRQGVSISLYCRTERPVEGAVARVRYADLYGNRERKYGQLFEGRLATHFTELRPVEPYFFLTPKDFSSAEAYQKGVSLEQFFTTNNSGIKTDRDSLFLDFAREPLAQRMQTLLFGRFDRRFAAEYGVQDSGSYAITTAIKNKRFSNDHIRRFLYRPFDLREIYYDRDIISRPAFKVMAHLSGRTNLALIAPKYSTDELGALATNVLCGHKSFSAYDISYVFPLYLYPAPTELDQTRRVNFEPKLFAKLRKLATHPMRGEPDEVAVFDYIYGVLHCPAYRETYAEFLKIDFPRIPWPASPDVFWDVSDKGGQLRRLHLMESAAVGDTPYPFTGEGAGKVEKVEFREGAVWINKDQRFENAPEISWGFHIGGYQPAQKWLKDRKGRSLDFEDVQHYQRILKILAETGRIMKTIEMPLAG